MPREVAERGLQPGHTRQTEPKQGGRLGRARVGRPAPATVQDTAHEQRVAVNLLLQSERTWPPRVQGQKVVR